MDAGHTEDGDGVLLETIVGRRDAIVLSFNDQRHLYTRTSLIDIKKRYNFKKLDYHHHSKRRHGGWGRVYNPKKCVFEAFTPFLIQ